MSFVSLIRQGQDIETSLYPHIYTNLANSPCVRLLNATHTIGCQGRRGTQCSCWWFYSFFFSKAPSTGSGVLFQINTQDEVSYFVNQVSLNDAFAIVLPYSLLTP
jgi:hypothetical protein